MSDNREQQGYPRPCCWRERVRQLNELPPKEIDKSQWFRSVSVPEEQKKLQKN